jgi:two-component system, chemotaxis family, chemotaxis protein CheY
MFPMDRTDFSAHRILIVGAKTPTTGLLRSVLGIVGVTRILQIQDTARALELLAMESFTAVFCSHDVAPFQDMTFPVAARRRHGMLNPTIPIFMLQARARRRDVEMARDTGVTDVMTTPISPRTIMTKLKAAEVSPRPFIVAPEFFGPDRRASNRAPWSGADRRKRLAKKTKVDFHHI